MKKIILPLLLGLATIGFGQKIKVIEGDLGVLKGQKSVNAEFTYDKMSVGKFPDEADYIAKKKEEYDKKEPGRGDKWEAQWIADRKERFEPQFRELFSKYADMSTVDANAPYTLIFKTTMTEPGWNIGISRSPAFINAEVWVVDTKSPEKVLSKVSITKSPGRDAMGYDYETGAPIQEAYAKAGKELGAMIKKLK
jgi:hypothetical protein